MDKTKEYIRFTLIDGSVHKRTIYKDEAGKKYIYNQRRFWALDEFKTGWKIRFLKNTISERSKNEKK